MRKEFLAVFSGFPDHHFSAEITERLRLELTRRKSIVFITACPLAYEQNDDDCDGMHEMFAEQGLPFEKHCVIDKRTEPSLAKELVEHADCIFLMGGGVCEEQLDLIREKGCYEALLHCHAAIFGVSAGSMNMAKNTVDFFESMEPIEGLGLTDFTVSCHHDPENQWRYEQTLRMSEDRVVYAMEDMSALFIKDGKVDLVGKIYRVENRNLRLLTKDDMKMSMNHIEKYKKYFTKEYLMGPNSFRLLDELIRRSPESACFDRTLDLGCGFALTSLFIANETDAKHVYAFDLWVPATENYLRIQDNGLEDKIIPIHGDAMDMPFAEDYFDTIISVDAYHYFGCKEGVFTEKILPYVKKGGFVMIVVPGLKEQPQGELKQVFETWAEGDDSELFKTAAWWENLLKEECKDQCSIEVKEADCYDIAWQEWFASGHEYGIRDQEFLDQGLYDILNFLLIYVRKE